MEEENVNPQEQSKETFLYTIGHTKSYDQGLKEEPIFMLKIGKRSNDPRYGDYEGGIVWQTREEAEQFLEGNKDQYKDFSVYGICAKWDTDTTVAQGEENSNWRRLLYDSQIVQLPKKE